MTAQLFDFPSTPPILAKPTKKPRAKKPDGYTEEFETKIWQPYPRKLNCSKFDAFKAYNRLPSELQAQAIAALAIFARGCVGKDEAYIPHCATWLNQRRFETVVVRSAKPIPSTDSPDWPAIMKLYRMTSNWRQEHGPAPGLKNCRVPQEFWE